MNELIYLGQMLRISGDDGGADGAALKIAQTKSGEGEAKLLTYVSCHKKSAAYRAALRRVLFGLKWALYLSVMVAGLTGFLAGFTAFKQTGTGGQVNVFWLLASLLGVHALSLLIWAAFIWRSPVNSVSLLSALSRAIAWLTRRQPQKALAARSVADVQLSGTLGRASISTFSHGFWCVYLLAGFLASVILLSVQSYQFMWETTLLQPQTAVSIFKVIGKPLSLIGFQVPSIAAITAAENLGVAAQSKQDAAIWARFCLTALVVYGVAPRLVLWAVSAVWRRRLASSMRLDASDPFFAGLLAQIYQPPAAVAVVDPDSAAPGKAGTKAAPITRPTAAPKLGTVIGWEIDALDESLFGGATIAGLFEDKRALEAAVGALQGSPVTLAVSLLNTPDRGVERALAAFSAVPVDKRSAVLIDVETLQDRAQNEDAKRRIGDWWSLLIRLGFDQSAITILGAQRA